MEARRRPKVSVVTLTGRTAVTVTLDGDDLSRVDALLLAGTAVQSQAEALMADQAAAASELEAEVA